MMSERTAHGEPRGQIFDVQRFSIHDGPGIRTTVFFKGCPLRCAWCQNPESVSADAHLMLYPDLCVGCSACAEVCPVIDAEGPGAASDGPGIGRPRHCAVCGACAEACPTGARRIAGREATVSEVVEEILRDRPFYGEEGGATFGGGEPLAQWEFAAALAGALHDEGVRVALDTACLAPPDALAAVPSRFDLVLADLKAVSPDLHRTWTGGDNAAVLEAIRRWSGSLAGRLWISVPLVPGVHDESEMGRIAEFLAGLEGPPPVRLLPYHRIGESKYVALGKERPGIEPAGDGLVEIAAEALRRRGLEVM